MAVTQTSENAKSVAAHDTLEEYVKEYKIFIDTCSLLNPAIDQFWKNIIPLLDKYGAKIIIPHRCAEELMKHQNNKNKPELAKQALNSTKLVKQMLEAGYVEIRGEDSDNFADNVFNVVFTKFRMKYNLLLITQDKSLAEDILKLNDSRSVASTKTIHVKKINKYGFLSRVHYGENQQKTETGRNNSPSSKPPTVVESEKFAICSKITDIRDDRMPVTHLPGENENVYVYVNGKWAPVRLENELGHGGEALIYSTNTQFVAKIYKKENNTRRKYEKIKLMLTKNINCPGICYPVAAVFNEAREYVGFLMPAANGKELQRGIFLVKQLFLKNFPGWKKRDTVELCITILEKIKYLHDRNIIMGDINPANILVVSPKEVYFVDTDSYQIEDFPCPVGTINYTAPEIQRKHFGDFLRTMGNENFAVATLLFMIMLPGKPPYSQQGGADPIANIINMDFSYPFGESSNKKTPDGPWRYIWSHLTYDLKEAFYHTFHKDGQYSKENTRLSADEWLSMFRYYLELLDSGKFGQQDKMSEELYPTRHKKSSKFTYITCKLCQTETPENQCQNGMCRNCLNKGETYKCSKCGKDILFTNYQKYIKHAKPYEICSECFENGNRINRTITCAGCGRNFGITNSEYEFYMSKGYDLPKRCKTCRDNKTPAAVNPTHNKPVSNPHPSIPKPTSPPPSSHSNGTLCFITTAVCNYYGKPDDCAELTALRGFRDNWLRKQPDGEKLISEYYNTAPLIVSKLEVSEYYSEYCEKLWNEYINPCLQLISQKKYEECKRLYTDMFYYMKNEFVTKK